MKQYQTYIFDLDGTISDTMTIWLQIFRDCLVHVGVETATLSDDEIAKYTHDWSTIVNLGVSTDDIPIFAEHARTLANTRLPDADQFPQAYETLEALRSAGKHVAIVSAMDRVIFEPAMQHNQLYDVAQVAVAGNDVPNRKPAPDGLLKALSDLGVPKSDFDGVVYMGDKDTDIQAAHNAGIDATLFFPPAHQLIYDRAATLQHNPETVITGWQELLDAVTAPGVRF